MFFLFPFLDALAQGRVIRRVVCIILRVKGVLAAIMGLVAFLAILVNLSQAGAPTDVALAAVLTGLILVAASVCLLQVCFYRARKVEALKDGPFTVIPVLSALLRGLGEGLAILFAAAGLAAALGSWIAGPQVAQPAMFFLPALPIHNPFFLGFLLLVGSLVQAFATLLLFYFLAESTLVLVDMAQNLRSLADRSR